MEKLKIVLLGAGNLATHLSKSLFDANHEIIQIYSRKLNSAEALANKYGCHAISEMNNLNNDADLYIIAVSDHAISEFAKNDFFINRKVLHTSGSVELSVFNPEIKHYGVLYPVQTFSKSRSVEFCKIPICIEASNKEFELFLEKLASQLSVLVYQIDSFQRKRLHLAAVFANNFVNHLYYISKDIISKENLDFNLLLPLIKETASKVFEMDPLLAQTGPALRNDIDSLEKHLELLSSMPEYLDIYKIITNDICLKHKEL
jgi:predicted short-subunit dehydrogenase-like oxidoreductase (DUF2520 family)